MKVQVVASDALWDELVAIAPAATVFHSCAWMRASGFEFLRLGVIENGVVVAGLVLQVDPQGAGTLGSITPYLGPLVRAEYEGEASRKRLRLLAREAIDRAVTPHFFSSPWASEVQPFVMEGYRGTLLYTYAVPLREEGGWRRRARPKLRRNLAAARRDGLRIAEERDPTILLGLVEETFRRQGTTPWFSLPECDRVLRAMADAGRGRCFIAFDAQDRAIAGVAVVWNERHAHYLLGGYDEEFAHRGGSSLAMGAAMDFCAHNLTVDTFDLEGTFVPRIEAFMREFGGDLLPFYLFQRPRGPLIAFEPL